MIAFLSAPSFRELTWYLSVLALALPMSVIAKSEQPKTVKWEGIETFENAYTYSGRISAHLGNVNEYNHKIIVRFTYVEEADAQGARKFTSRKISWTAQGKAVATKFTSTTCNGSGALELVGLSDGDLNEKLKIPCTRNDKGILAGSFTKPPDRIRPPKIVDWQNLRDTCIYSEERNAPSGERYTYTVRASPCECEPTMLYASTLDGRIFSEPSTTSTVLGSPPNGTRLHYTNTTHVNGQAWYYVHPSGRSAGWMSGSQLSCTRPVAAPIRRTVIPLDPGIPNPKDRPNAAQAAGGRG